MKTNKLNRLRYVMYRAYRRVLATGSKTAMTRHYRIVVALDQAEAEEAVAQRGTQFHKCPDCGVSNGRPLTVDNLWELCYGCQLFRSDKDVKSA
jgi:hypothetical protein